MKIIRQDITDAALERLAHRLTEEKTGSIKIVAWKAKNRGKIIAKKLTGAGKKSGECANFSTCFFSASK